MSMTPSPIAAVVFDYGGVLTTPVGETIAAWLADDRIDPASFTEVLKSWLGRDAEDGTPIHRLETGDVSVADFDAQLAAALRTTDGSAINPDGVLQRLFAQMRPDEAMWTLATDLLDAGIAVGLLSNSWGNTYPRARIDALFDPVVISGEVGLRKPGRAIFDLTVDRLGIAHENVVFIDDAEPNLIGARAAGLVGLLHTDAASTRAELAAMIPTLEA